MRLVLCQEVPCTKGLFWKQKKKKKARFRASSMELYSEQDTTFRKPELPSTQWDLIRLLGAPELIIFPSPSLHTIPPDNRSRPCFRKLCFVRNARQWTGTNWIGGWVCPTAGLDTMKKCLSLPGMNSRFLGHPVATCGNGWISAFHYAWQNTLLEMQTEYREK
jgi:hypothetical protein